VLFADLYPFQATMSSSTSKFFLAGIFFHGIYACMCVLST
jgi:hypothetical protein